MAEQSVEVVKGIDAAFATGDVPGVLGAFSEDIEARYTGTGKETGKDLDQTAVHVWNIRDGKAARFRQFMDTVKFAEVVPLDVSVAR